MTVTVDREGSLVIKAARRRYKLEQLASRISARNRYEEVDWGRPKAREIW